MNKDVVNKILIKKYEKSRDPDELLQPSGRYRDEERQFYLEKCEEFQKKIVDYTNENRMVVTNRTTRLGYMPQMITVEELRLREAAREKYIKALDESSIFPFKQEGKLKIRSVRTFDKAFSEKETEDETTLYGFNNPWFIRFVTLKRFIEVARGTVYKNRMLKNLEKLKKLTPDDIKIYEKEDYNHYESNFRNLFDKFLYGEKDNYIY